MFAVNRPSSQLAGQICSVRVVWDCCWMLFFSCSLPDWMRLALSSHAVWGQDARTLLQHVTISLRMRLGLQGLQSERPRPIPSVPTGSFRSPPPSTCSRQCHSKDSKVVGCRVWRWGCSRGSSVVCFTLQLPTLGVSMIFLCVSVV